MTDALSLLREFTIAHKPISLVNSDGQVVTKITEATHVVFADGDRKFTFPRSEQTNYRKNMTDDKYALETLLYLLQRPNLSAVDYAAECAGLGLPIVSLLDRRVVLEYMTGVTATSASIVYTAVDSNKRAAGDDMVGQDEDHTAKKPRPAPQTLHGDLNEVLRIIQSKERPSRTTSNMMRGNKSFTNISKAGMNFFIKGIKQKTDKPGLEKKPDPRHPNGVAPPPTLPVARSAASTTPGSSVPGQKPRSSSSRIPIIIVPQAITSMVTMANIKQLLEDQSFVSGDQLRKDGAPKPPPRLVIERKRKVGETQKVIYHIVDNADSFTPEEWDRVVCVFTAGVEWPFKKWKWSKPVELFSHVKGFYAKWSDEQPKETIKSWNIEILNFSRHKRHADRATVTEFWDSLASWCNANKPHLVY